MALRVLDSSTPALSNFLPALSIQIFKFIAPKLDGTMNLELVDFNYRDTLTMQRQTLLAEFQMAGAAPSVLTTARDFIAFTQFLNYDFEIDVDDGGDLSFEVYVKQHLTLYIALERNGNCKAGLLATGGEIREYFPSFSMQVFRELEY